MIGSITSQTATGTIATTGIGTLLNIVLYFIINLSIKIIGIISKPLNDLFTAIIPNINEYVSSIGTFTTYIESSISFVLGWLNIPSDLLNMFILYYMSRLLLFITINTFKIAWKWVKFVIGK